MRWSCSAELWILLPSCDGAVLLLLFRKLSRSLSRSPNQSSCFLIGFCLAFLRGFEVEVNRFDEAPVAGIF